MTMDNETTKKRMTKDEKWLLYVQNARIEERNKAIQQCIELLIDSDVNYNGSNIIDELEALKK